MTPPTTLAIINYNGRNFLEELLDSLAAQTCTEHEVWLVDNASTDQSVDFVRSRWPKIRIVAFSKNLGFSKAGNFVFRHSVTPYVGLLNCDLCLDSHWLETLIGTLESTPGCVAAAPKMMLHAKPFTLNGIGGCMNRLGYTWDRGMNEIDRGQYDRIEEVIFAPAAAALFRRHEFLEAGGFDERFFMYHEDVDFGWRSWLLGKTSIAQPDAVVRHHFGGTTRNAKGMLWRELLGERNNIRSLIKNYEFSSLKRVLFELLRLPQAPRRKILQMRNFVWNILFLPETLSLRRSIQRRRVRSDHDMKTLIVQSNHVPISL